MIIDKGEKNINKNVKKYDINFKFMTKKKISISINNKSQYLITDNIIVGDNIKYKLMVSFDAPCDYVEIIYIGRYIL